MFVLNTSGQYNWPVELSVPVDGGKHEKMKFNAKFNRIPQSKLQELLTKEGTTDKSFCREILAGWSDVKAEDGSDLEFNGDNLDALLDFPSLAETVVKTYIASLKEVRAKN